MGAGAGLDMLASASAPTPAVANGAQRTGKQLVIAVADAHDARRKGDLSAQLIVAGVLRQVVAVCVIHWRQLGRSGGGSCTRQMEVAPSAVQLRWRGQTSEGERPTVTLTLGTLNTLGPSWAHWGGRRGRSGGAAVVVALESQHSLHL